MSSLVEEFICSMFVTNKMFKHNLDIDLILLKAFFYLINAGGAVPGAQAGHCSLLPTNNALISQCFSHLPESILLFAPPASQNVCLFPISHKNNVPQLPANIKVALLPQKTLVRPQLWCLNIGNLSEGVVINEKDNNIILQIILFRSRCSLYDIVWQ